MNYRDLLEKRTKLFFEIEQLKSNKEVLKCYRNFEINKIMKAKMFQYNVINNMLKKYKENKNVDNCEEI